MSAEAWGIWLPSAGPVDRPHGAWLRPIDEPGVDVAMVFRSRDEAQEALDDQRRKFGVDDDGQAEVAPFDWSRESSEAKSRG